MAICGVCYQNCRGKCAKCGARLCVQHKPKTARAKCPLCPVSTRGSKNSSKSQTPGNAYYTPSNPQAQAAYSVAQPATTKSSTTSTRPPARPPAPAPNDLEAMSAQEIVRHMQDLIHQLELKQVRELAYLQRRYDRGTYTPTDQAYGEDQILEDKLLELLRFIAKQATSW